MKNAESDNGCGRCRERAEEISRALKIWLASDNFQEILRGFDEFNDLYFVN